MSDLAPYQAYRDEKRQTFSRIPDHWGCLRVRHLARIRTGSGDTVDAQPDGAFPFYVRSDRPLLSDKWEFDTNAVLTAGDGAGVAKVFHLVSGRFMAHQRVYVLDDFRRVTPRFFYYSFSSLFHLMALDGSAKSTVDSVRRPMIADMPIAVPPLEEQNAIADYLDRETARIDTLIEEQQRLIEMLRERRLAAITESVVASTAVDRSSRASNWYPSLPANWGHGRVKSIAGRVTDGAHISPDTLGGVFDFVSTRDLDSGSVTFDTCLKTTPETYEYMVKTGCQPRDGDVLFSKDGTVGETAVVRGDHPFVVASSLVIITPDAKRMDADYLAYVFASKTAREQAASMMRGAGLPRLSVGNLARLEVPIPPLLEQRQIVAYLDEQTAKVDSLIAETARFIELARERRSALITAAVTGQIDVREVA